MSKAIFETIQSLSTGKQIAVNEIADQSVALGERVIWVDSISAMQALDFIGASEKTTVHLTDAARFGDFSWSAGDHSADISKDPGQGIYVAPSADLTGASGAFVREHNAHGPFCAEWWGYTTGSDSDMRPALQNAILFTESVSQLTQLNIPSGNAIVSSLAPDAVLPSYAQGDKVGIVLKRPDLVDIRGDNSKVSFDINSPAVEAADSLFAVAPETSADQAYLRLSNIWLDGGEWPLKSSMPKNTIKADYRVCSYSNIVDVFSYNSREDNIVFCGFVVTMTNVRARNAGTAHSNFKFVSEAQADGQNGARTAFALTRCVADYAGYYGFNFEPSEGGFTYCHLDTCAADHIGRDASNETIPGTETIATGYRIGAARNIVLTGCGTEWCTSVAKLDGGRNITINGIYGTGNGSTNGVDVPASMEIKGYYERINIAGFEDRSPVGVLKTLRLDSVAAFNTNAITLDHSIPRSEIEFVGGDTTSRDSLIYTLGDFYKNGVRWDGSARMYGDKTTGFSGTNWFSQNESAVEKTFLFHPASSAPMEVARLTNPAADGYIGFILEVLVGRKDGATPQIPSRYIVCASSANGSQVATSEKVDAIGQTFGIVASWAGTDLRVTVAQDFTVVSIKATAMGRPGIGTQTFEWL